MADKRMEPNPDYYQETVKRMEPDISWVDTAAGWASCSISLRRIADDIELMRRVVICSAVLFWIVFIIKIYVELRR